MPIPRHRQRSDGVLRWGGAVKRLHGAPANLAADCARCSASVARRAERQRCSRSWRLDEAFFASHEDVDLCIARGCALRCRYGMTRSSGTWDARARTVRVQRLQGQRNWNDVLQEHPGDAVVRRCLPTMCCTRGGGRAFARAGNAGEFCVRARGGIRDARLYSAPPFSARGRWLARQLAALARSGLHQVKGSGST